MNNETSSRWQIPEWKTANREDVFSAEHAAHRRGCSGRTHRRDEGTMRTEKRRGASGGSFPGREKDRRISAMRAGHAGREREKRLQCRTFRSPAGDHGLPGEFCTVLPASVFRNCVGGRVRLGAGNGEITGPCAERGSARWRAEAGASHCTLLHTGSLLPWWQHRTGRPCPGR